MNFIGNFKIKTKQIKAILDEKHDDNQYWYSRFNTSCGSGHMMTAKILNEHSLKFKTIKLLLINKLFNKTASLLKLYLLTALFIPMSALAEDNLKMTITSLKVDHNSAGEIVYTPVKAAEVGSLVQYRANFLNTSDEALFDTTITLPIPTNTLFNGQASPQSVQASSDYYNYQDLPIKRMQNGNLVTVPLSEYKSLRWNIKFLPSKKSVTVTFNTIVK